MWEDVTNTLTNFELVGTRPKGLEWVIPIAYRIA